MVAYVESNPKSTLTFIGKLKYVVADIVDAVNPTPNIDVPDIFSVFKDNVFPSYVKPDCAIAPSAVPSDVKTLVNAGS